MTFPKLDSWTKKKQKKITQNWIKQKKYTEKREGLEKCIINLLCRPKTRKVSDIIKVVGLPTNTNDSLML